MKTTSISTKEIHNDLFGFLLKFKNGHTIQVMYRSKPLVTLTAKDTYNTYLTEDAGTPNALKRSIEFINSLPERPVIFDSKKSFKKLYEETYNQ